MSTDWMLQPVAIMAAMPPGHKSDERAGNDAHIPGEQDDECFIGMGDWFAANVADPTITS
ncbi:MAG: hypothetical protein IPI41_10535 [Flavobacteriales bacterium]|nr:hypothetical protein [Flavobacteriales bacterium]